MTDRKDEADDGAARGLGHAFWEEAEQVQEFASRAPDHRLTALVKEYPDPGRVRVLDLACAGGRNTEFLIREGFDVTAVDASLAMVNHVRTRVAPLLPPEELTTRVRVGRMDSLPFLADRSFDLVVALGVYFLARTEEELDAALAETVRLLAPRGRCLVANFGPGFGPLDAPLARVAGTSVVYSHPRFETLCLLSVEESDQRFAGLGLMPQVPTECVVREADGNRRVTVNGLYRRG